MRTARFCSNPSPAAVRLTNLVCQPSRTRGEGAPCAGLPMLMQHTEFPSPTRGEGELCAGLPMLMQRTEFPSPLVGEGCKQDRVVQSAVRVRGTSRYDHHLALRLAVHEE